MLSQVPASTQFVNFSPSQGVIHACHTFDALNTAVTSQYSSFPISSHRARMELIAFLLSFIRSLTDITASSHAQTTWTEAMFLYFEAGWFSKVSSEVKETQEV